MALQFGAVEPPPRPFDDQPTIIVYDRTRYIVNPNNDLAPFTAITTIVNIYTNLAQQINRPNRSLTMVMIFPYVNDAEVLTFLQNNILQHPGVKFLHLFFNSGDANNLTTLCGTRLRGYNPITNRTTVQTRAVCANTNDLNIDYCQKYHTQYYNSGDIGLANLFATQMSERINLQCQYIAILRREFEQQLFE
ncbi:hypothetical protein I4U23_003551 [Adineta vaga]|nr:hypothetical protein I4U23_003551 [Adineta vaga]